MTALITMRRPEQVQSASITQDVFNTSTVQRLVKDEVAFAPVQNPYLALQKAVDRLQSGKSVFFESVTEAEELLALARHG
jgi:hypothetical protein